MPESQPTNPSRQRYLERAAELREMAFAATDEEIKIEMLVLAQQYEKLADDVAKRSA